MVGTKACHFTFVFDLAVGWQAAIKQEKNIMLSRDKDGVYASSLLTSAVKLEA